MSTSQSTPRPAAAGSTPARPAAGSVTEGDSREPLTSTGMARRVKLRVQRVDPWSVCKMAVLFSIALGIAGVVASMVLWMILSGMGVFDAVNDAISGLVGSGGKQFSLDDYVGFSRVLSLSTAVAVINVLLMTALATLGAFLYNVCAGLVGGVQMTLTDD